jgi:hypothetical protein
MSMIVDLMPDERTGADDPRQKDDAASSPPGVGGQARIEFVGHGRIGSEGRRRVSLGQRDEDGGGRLRRLLTHLGRQSTARRAHLRPQAALGGFDLYHVMT